ncbi:antiactivator of flagellar biosynthesis FleN protein [Noviherbaspirillum cavernae]|uniref:Antiactivator of flagellar biosynthesis FleN protein n=1 Tax=Noviherbaspirillum cavernae TaxID=2320862 RepID=A0A418X0B6_9BURK|nr:antiactivator of flagellar biosynthesis FleN protein [Noviherbaspirillum cavernae]RJG05928.1 antiactivator of flagellar biosynthesis FleN protein [Noviherbaspirillum cavernae]
MGNYASDQAEGLRRMLAGPKPRIYTFLSATSDEEKGAMLVNLGASLAQSGSDVLMVDACVSAQGIAERMGATQGASLLQVARQERALDEVVQRMPQGFGIAALAHGAQRSATREPQEMQRLANAFGVLSTQADIVVVDAELGKDDAFPIPTLAGSEIVVQVSTSPESITTAYSIIKRINGEVGRRPFSILITGASEKEAKVVYQNMAQAANRYLAVKLNSVGSVPADEHTTRAARLGRSVVDAFPLAGASVAFRRLAERISLPELPGGELQGVAPAAARLGL